ncbi:hypothetical protein ACFL3R_00690 [Thermodesulfobacteriota bacterium]
MAVPFDESKIIRRYKLREFLEIPKYKTFERVSSNKEPIKYRGAGIIDVVTVKADSRSNTAMLETWMEHFKSMGIPFAVTQHKDPDVKVLWKERRC